MMIRIDRQQAKAFITLDRTSGQNTVSTCLVKELSLIFTDLHQDETVRVVILIGFDNALEVEAEIAEVPHLTPEKIRQITPADQILPNLVQNLGKPVIIAIDGFVPRAWSEFVSGCTWRIASPKAMFTLPETLSNSMISADDIIHFSPEDGRACALEMVLSGNPINAEEALRIGLVNQLVSEPEELISVCEELAERISRNSPLAIKYALESVNHGSKLSLADGLRLESALFALCFATEDMLEGAKAFLEKRQAIFEGR